VTGKLRWYFGPMNCGKSTLVLQIHYNQERQGRRGLLLVRHDRSGEPRVSSRMGVSREAIEIGGGDMRLVLAANLPTRRMVDYVVVDEAQFLTPSQVEVLSELADDGVDVHCFGIATDFQSNLFPGARRLFELADELHPIQVEVLCWCGEPGRFNARVQDGVVQRDGDQVVVGNTDEADRTHYRVLCRRHWRTGALGTAKGEAA
jgi:thymidine kinase